jgi:hypothetical protein
VGYLVDHLGNEECQREHGPEPSFVDEVAGLPGEASQWARIVTCNSWGFGDWWSSSVLLVTDAMGGCGGSVMACCRDGSHHCMIVS